MHTRNKKPKPKTKNNEKYVRWYKPINFGLLFGGADWEFHQPPPCLVIAMGVPERGPTRGSRSPGPWTSPSPGAGRRGTSERRTAAGPFVPNGERGDVRWWREGVKSDDGELWSRLTPLPQGDQKTGGWEHFNPILLWEKTRMIPSWNRGNTGEIGENDWKFG